MKATRIVCWFSCGAASAVATKLAINENAGKLPLIVARAIVREEHSDNDRFAADCQKWFGVPITNLINEKYDGSIYEVFRQRNFISGINGAPCTMHLKKEPRLNMQLPNDVQIFGYCADEQERWDRFIDANNIDAKAPLIERGIMHDDCLAIVQKSGIELPTMYKLGYQHNNCIGCCKAGGKGYWNKIRVDFPAQFQRMADECRRLGVRMIKDADGSRLFLDELKDGEGDHLTEPSIQCGIFCEMASNEISGYNPPVAGVGS